MAIGKLWKWFGTRTGMAILLGQLALVLVFAYLYHGYHSSDRCVACHADKARMTALGHPEFVMTRAEVQKESHHPNTECRDCHLGNGLADDPAGAHQGMLKLIVLDQNLHPIPRDGHVKRILPSGIDQQRRMLPRLADGSFDPAVGTLLWQDRNPVTLGYDPARARETCGKPACHPEEVKQFATSNMGANFRQRSMRFWTDIHGPNNCGPSFADVQPRHRAEGDRFSFVNTDRIRAQINLPFTNAQAIAKQKACNICHAGCLDCHYTPSRKNGVHSFSRIPPAINCSGGGRSTFVCHSGTMERRRGDSYLGQDLSEPPGMPPDVHVAQKITCVDCHETGPGGMGHLERNAGCQDCHVDAEEALAKGVHKNLACAACHVQVLGGYEMTSWGPGLIESEPNPFKKYSLYYGPQKPPILIRDQTGRWIPVKIWPNSVGGIKDTIESQPGLTFRWPQGETHDAYALLGTFGFPGGNNNYLAWLQVEEVAHPLGKARTCTSCHGSPTQVAHVTWRFFDDQGAWPFTGSQEVTASSRGIHVQHIRATSPITLMDGGRIKDFAAWLKLGDIWKTKGDFAIPRPDPVKYRTLIRENARVSARLAALKRRVASAKNKKLLLRRWEEAREAAMHDPRAGEQELDEFFSSAAGKPLRGADAP